MAAIPALGQSINQSQLRGTITDSSGAVIAGANVTITDVGTNISQSTVSNSRGSYAFTALRASHYKLLVSAPTFGPVEKNGITLTVNEETTLDVMLLPSSQTTSVTVESIPQLLDSDSATLGTDIPSEYLTQMPLQNRDPFGITFLAAGVTESAGSGVSDSYPAGTNFISNGQRNSTANILLDGVLITAPEQGEGGNSNLYYQATVEGLQEVKVQNNSFSAEYGGGTVVDEVMKSGTNHLHGSGYWFNQDAIFDARDFYNTGPRPGHVQNQAGFSLGGPIKRDKTFFFADLESVTANSPVNIVATVPTAAETNNGDFSQAMTYDQNGNPTLNQIFDPFLFDPATQNRPAYNNNTIPQGEIDPVGQAIMKLYPQPTSSGDAVTGANNFRDVILSTSKSLQIDVKADQQFSPKSSVSVRYSSVIASGSTPTVMGDNEYNDGTKYTEQVYNDGINYTFTPTAHTLWTSTFGLDRVAEPTQNSNYPSPTSVGFPSYLEQGGISRMPSIIMEQSPWTSLFDQCCVDTHFAHTLLNYASSFSWTKGQHTLKFGGQQEIFYNNFFQPNYPGGFFSFAQDITAQEPYNASNPYSIQGNDFASLLIGWGDPGGSGINVTQSVADKSLATGFYAQDDWRVTPKLTLNLGVRYQWDNPFSERHNNSQFSDMTGDSGITVPGLPGQAGTLKGTTIFASSGNRSVPAYLKDVGPRLGFAYLVNKTTAIRGGAGLYFGYGVATNFQYPGAAYTSSPEVFFTQDEITRQATLENPFPGGVPPAEGEQYGKLALWGLNNQNSQGTTAAKDANIYQWNLGVQQAFPDKIVVSINYSANRSTFLPWAGTDNRNFIASSVRRKYTTTDLNGLVSNPFEPLFSGPNALFNAPSSRYSNSQLPLLNTLRPYPQFDGVFEEYKIIGASSWYNALQVVFQKREGRYVNFEGNYTWSKNTDDSSAGNNDWVGSLGNGFPQELDHLKAEWSASASDATDRFVLAGMFQLPVGRGSLIGSKMNRALDAVVGGWQLTTLLTFQSGQPLDIHMGNGRIADGNQRPNVLCSAYQLTTGISIHDAGEYGLPYLNSNCFSDPGDQQPGNAPRYISQLRSEGIHQADLSLEKSHSLGGEKRQLEVHVDCFNCTNTERFGLPDSGYEDSTFGVIASTAGGALPRNMQLGIRYQF
jgi:hypothetical protein